MEVIDNLKPHIQDVFQPDFVNKFLQKISTTSYPFLQYWVDQSEVSQLSTAETYYSKIQPGSAAIFIPPVKERTTPNSANSVASTTTNTKRSYIHLNYGDEV